MLARSNNVLESFFRVFKHVILQGKAAKSLTALLNVWVEYQRHIMGNLFKANIDFYQILRSEPQAKAARSMFVEEEEEEESFDLDDDCDWEEGEFLEQEGEEEKDLDNHDAELLFN